MTLTLTLAAPTIVSVEGTRRWSTCECAVRLTPCARCASELNRPPARHLRLTPWLQLLDPGAADTRCPYCGGTDGAHDATCLIKRSR